MSGGLASIEREIAAEKAAALARIAGTLEALLGELARLGAALPFLEGDERADALASHHGLRDRARLWRWYLEVQREAVGLRRHEDLDRIYPLPAPLDPAGGP